MYLLNGSPLRIDTPFTVGDINYPPNWLRLSSEADKAAIGIHWVDDQPRPDDRFYWVTDNNDGTFSKTPKDLAQLKEQYVEQAKQIAHSLLMESDWLVLREVEEPGKLPADIKTYRHDVREYSGTREAEINACADVPALEALVNAETYWPMTPKERAKREAIRAQVVTGKGDLGVKRV